MIGPDEIRDTRSRGTYWNVDRKELRLAIKEEFFFYVEQTNSELLAQVYSKYRIVAVVS